jgi:hypothetical protein
MKHCALTLLVFSVIGFFAAPKLTAQQDTVITIYGKKFAPGVEVFINAVKVSSSDVLRINSNEIRVKISTSFISNSIQPIADKVQKSAGSSITSAQYIEWKNYVEVKNPLPSRGSAITEIAVVQLIVGEYLGKWNQKTIKFLINNQVPREIVKEIAIVVRAFNDIGMDLILELDTLNFTTALPGKVPVCGEVEDKDGFNVIGIRDIPSNRLQQQIGGRGIIFPELCDSVSRKNPRRRIITETDLVIDKRSLDSNLLKVGSITDLLSKNVTWIIAHEIGHCLGLGHSQNYESVNGELVPLTWENALMVPFGRPTRWIGSIPERERKLLKGLYGTK